MKVALYARFSSEKQDAELSIGAQLKALKEYAINHDFEFSENYTFIDEAKSALSDNRPEFKKMIATSKKKPRPFDAILVWKLSRFARNRKDSIVYKSLLKSLGIEVISINEPFDDSPAGQLLEGIIEVIDEFYSANLGQDTLRGMTENAKRGFFNGGKPPIGLKRQTIRDGSTERTKLDLDPTYAPIVKRMFDMAADGMSLKSIAETLNQEGIKTPLGKKWNKQTISNLLTNELYTGTLIWNRSTSRINHDPVRIENAHPAIVDRLTFQKVQETIAIKRNARAPRSISSHYLLSGFLTCGKCGSSLVGYSVKSRGTAYFYYACARSLNQGKSSCNFKPLPKDHLEGWVLQRLQEGLLNDELLQKFIEKTNTKILHEEKSLKDEISSISNQIKSTKKRLDHLYEALESGKVEALDLAPRIKELRTSLETLQQRKVALLDQGEGSVETVDLQAVKAYISRIKDMIAVLKPEQRKHLLKTFFKRITVHPERIDMEAGIPFLRKALTKSDLFMSLDKYGSPQWTNAINQLPLSFRRPDRKDSANPLDKTAAEIKRLRKAKGWTQEELAKQAGLSKKAIENLENRPACAKVTSLFRVCKALGWFSSFLPDLPVECNVKDISGRIGRRIAELRESKGLSLRQLAKKAGLSHVALWRYEHGKQVMSLGELVKLFGALP